MNQTDYYNLSSITCKIGDTNVIISCNEDKDMNSDAKVDALVSGSKVDEYIDNYDYSLELIKNRIEISLVIVKKLKFLNFS